MKYRVIKDHVQEVYIIEYKKHWYSSWEYFATADNEEELSRLLDKLFIYRDRATIFEEESMDDD